MMKLWLARDLSRAYGGSQYLLSARKPTWLPGSGVWSPGDAHYRKICSRWWHRHDPDKQLRLKPGEGPVELKIERVGDAAGN
jgi:hypothetical protein